MANPEPLAILKQGVETWNAWREEHPDRGIDLSDKDLSAMNLTGVNLQRVKLTNTNLSGAILTRADLREARLFATNLIDVYLDRADLTGADLFGTILVGTSLRGCAGLALCEHSGPSPIDFFTLAMNPDLPPKFLRGCGLPDDLIEYLPSLLGRAFEFYSCFISYSSEDKGFATRLHSDLQENGVRCWYAPEDMRSGRKMHLQIDEAIRLYDRLLLVLSKEAMESNWVRTEIRRALKKEAEQDRLVLFPISLVPYSEIKIWKSFYADLGMDAAEEIREYYIPQFRDWKEDHEGYRQEFGKLLKSLKTDEREKASS